MAQAAFTLFGTRAREIDYADMVQILDQHSAVPLLNAHVPQQQLAQG
jgi:hypothetical protein